MTHRRHDPRGSDKHKIQHDKPNRPDDSHTQLATRQPLVISSDVPFTIDRKGDIGNVQYGGIDRYKIPRYRTFGHGRLIGLDRRHKIVAKSETEREVDNEAIDSSSRSGLFSLSQRQPSNLETPLARENTSHYDDFVEQRDYVRLGRKKRKVSNKARDEEYLDVFDTRIHSDTEQHSTVSSSESESSDKTAEAEQDPKDGDTFSAFKTHPDNVRYVELRNRTDRNPNDIDAWLELAEHQEQYFMLSVGIVQKTLNASQRRIVSEMKVSIYEKALTVVKQSKDELILGLMKEGAKIWDTHEQMARWDTVINRDCPVQFWYSYLNFYQSNAILFTFEKCLKVYARILNAISRLDAYEYDYHYAYIILRLTSFMLDAGFSERAIAIWQAVLEFNLCHSSVVIPNLQDFEGFWENEAPRLGEENAKGWCTGSNIELSPRVDDPLPVFSDADLFPEWAAAETERALSDMLPARVLDETVEDDPNRVILFSDLKDFISTTRSSQGATYLKQAFVQFCGLVPLQHGLSEATEKWRAWWSDSFVGHFEPNSRNGQVTDTTIMFAPRDSCLYHWDLPITKEKQFIQFANRALTQLAEVNRQDENLAEYVIALRLNLDAGSTRKFAKALLKQRPDCLLLYNAFAHVEICNGKFDSADNVWSTALSMADSLGEAARLQKTVLWHSWIWSLMERQGCKCAFALLTNALPLDVVDVNILQSTAKKDNDLSADPMRSDIYFREQIPNTIAAKSEIVPELIDLYAIYKYIQNSQSIDEVLATYSSYESLMTLGGLRPHTIERLHQLRARFLDFHIRTSPSGYKPKQLVVCLRDSLHRFPDNAILFELHEKCLRQAGMLDRVRDDQTPADDSCDEAIRLFRVVQRETSRPLFSGSTTHSIRRAFENATTLESPLHRAPGIWKSWIAFEASSSSTPGSRSLRKLKDVYLAALRACPGAKDVYMEVFRRPSLRALFDEGELESVYQSMLDRGIRIRHDISDVLEERADGKD